MKVGVVRFLGTNCDLDIWKAVLAGGGTPEWLWYEDRHDHKNFEAIVVPGGFSYGDYLRAGALAARSPVMETVKQAASHGTPILGICNGFQILCEAELLPGALIPNEGMRFIDDWVTIRSRTLRSFWNGSITSEKISLPIAHGEGRYYLPEQEIASLEDNDQIWWQYESNPNGSVSGIAGVLNKKGNVAGLMPHPERALYTWMGGSDGINFYTGLSG